MRHSAGTWSGKTSEVPTFPDELKGESASQFETRFWNVVSPSGLSGKVRPILRVDSGTRFPERAL